MGRKKLPLYKIVAADSRAPRDGRFIEAVGTYNPNTNPIKIEVKEERVFYWLRTGAQPTYTVKNLLSRKGLMLKHHLMKKGVDAQKIEDEYNKWSALQEFKLQKENEKRLIKKSKKKKAKPTGEKTEKAAEESAAPAEG
jgi:small subunit ribosomal protein S16